jgi:hypothetical protein
METVTSMDSTGRTHTLGIANLAASAGGRVFARLARERDDSRKPISGDLIPCSGRPLGSKALFSFLVVFLEIAMIAAGWRYCLEDRKTNGAASWWKRFALLGVIANTTAFGIPLVSIVYMIFYPSAAGRMRLPMINGNDGDSVSRIFTLWLNGWNSGRCAKPRCNSTRQSDHCPAGSGHPNGNSVNRGRSSNRLTLTIPTLIVQSYS